MPTTQDIVTAGLDAEELFRLGLKASGENDSAMALGFLKSALQKDPSHAKASWLLGAEYAQLGMMDRAKEALAHTLTLDPSLTGARFQYGLMMLTSGEIEHARQIWTLLDEQPENDPYRLFKSGLLHMVRDEFDQALALIQQALALPHADPALKNDMGMIIEQIKAAQNQPPAAPPIASPTAPVQNTEETTIQDQLRFTAYRSSDSTH